jgi:hypothetical protein
MPLPVERLAPLLRDLVAALPRLLPPLSLPPSAAVRGALSGEGAAALRAVLAAPPAERAGAVLDHALALRALSLQVVAALPEGAGAAAGGPAAEGIAAAQAALAALEADVAEGRAAPAVDLDALLVDAFALLAGVLALNAAHVGALGAPDGEATAWLLGGGARLRDGRGWRRPPAR